MSLVVGIVLLLLLSILLVLWFFMMPRFSGGADLSLLKTNYAHRGVWDTRLSQTPTDAILLASRIGYGSKIEVYVSRENTLTVAGKTPVPLSLVLSELHGASPLMIEIGGKAMTPRYCLRLAKTLDAYDGAFAIISRDPRMLAWFKTYRPNFARGQAISQRDDKLTAYLFYNYLSRPDFLVVEKTMNKLPSVLLLTKLFRLPCFVFGIDSLKDYRACRRQGEFVIFEKIRPKDPPKKGKKHEQFHL